MKDLRSRLTHGDPLRREGELSGAESHRLREQILAAKPAARVSYTKLMFPVAAMLLFVTAGSVWFVRTPGPAAALEPTEVRPRQLQFSTSGGTRIIWTFNDNLELR